MHADSHISWRFFAQVAGEHWSISDAELRNATFYISPIVFDRNANEVPLLVRSADIFWTGAGLSTMHPGSSTPFPTFVYSLPLTLLEIVGGWDTDYGAIGEDMHMFLKCFFARHGNLRAKVIHAAASQCNACSELKGIRGYVDGVRARYLQAARHMWGMLDTGFAIRLAIGLFARRWKLWFKRPLRFTRRLLRKCGISSTLRRPCYDTVDLDEDAETRSIHYWNILTIFCRLAEAHLVPLQVLVAVAVPTIFRALCPDAELPSIIAMSLHLCSALRILGLIMVVAFVRRYKDYHQLCARLRAEDITTAQKGGKSLDGDNVQVPDLRGNGLLEAAMSPLVGLLFGALPALQATALQPFTVRLKYIVSAKPLLVLKMTENNAERGDKKDDLL